MSQVLRVVTLNLGFHLPWDERRREVVAWFEELQPDVVLLQENVGAPGDSWADELAASTGFGVAHATTTGPMSYANAVLSRWPIETASSIKLPVGAPPARMRLGDEPRGADAIHATTQGFHLVGVHLSPAPEQTALRLRQSLALDDVCREIEALGATMPVILAGDFNSVPESDPIRFLGGTGVADGRSTHFQDAWRHAGDGSGETLDRNNPWHAATSLPSARIDYVFVGNRASLRARTGTVERADLAFNRALTGTFASDHFGLVVDICAGE